MGLEELIFTPQEISELREYRNSDTFIEKVMRVIVSSAKVYSTTPKSTKKAILTFPQFAGYNHMRVLKDALDVYDIENEEKIKKTILSFPKFVSLNHTRVLKDALDVYGIENEEKIKKAILSYPQFSGYNHTRLLKEKIKIAKLLNLSPNKVSEFILDNTSVSIASYTRQLAILDIVRELRYEGLEVTQKQIFNNFRLGAYVPNTNKLRISKARRNNELYEMPPLYEVLKKIALKNKN